MLRHISNNAAEYIYVMILDHVNMLLVSALHCIGVLDFKYLLVARMLLMGRNNIAPESISISSFMVTDVKTAKETQSIQEVCRTINENKIGSTVIIKDSSFNTKDNRLIDILTRRDIVRAI